jgi:bifunctional non-homologous end joining protein LigD
MSERVDFLAQLPVSAVIDGELVALDPDGKPDFPELCQSVLMRQRSTPLTFIAFDVLSVEGRNVMSLPHGKRREILKDLGLNDRSWRTPEAFDDGQALQAVDAFERHERSGS